VRRATLAALAGSVILAGLSVATLPFSHGLFLAQRSPYGERPGWILLQRAGPLLPDGSSVLVRTEPPDPANDFYLHHYGVALLPGRRIVPAALWGVPTSADLQREAGYEVVVGERPEPPPGRLLLEMPEGTVWRRER